MLQNVTKEPEKYHVIFINTYKNKKILNSFKSIDVFNKELYATKNPKIEKSTGSNRLLQKLHLSPYATRQFSRTGQTGSPRGRMVSERYRRMDEQQRKDRTISMRRTGWITF